MNLPLDWCINEVIKIVYLLYIYWIEPTIIKLGSVGGRYNSPH